jgi:hypothetical protein
LGTKEIFLTGLTGLIGLRIFTAKNAENTEKKALSLMHKAFRS